MTRRASFFLRLLLATLYALVLSTLTMEAWVDARAQQAERESKPLQLHPLPPELREAVEQLRAEKPHLFNTDMSAIYQLLLHRAGLPMDVSGFLRLLSEPTRTPHARINYLIAMERKKYTTLGFLFFVSEQGDYLVVLLPEQQIAPDSVDELPFFEVYDNAGGRLRSADYYAFRADEQPPTPTP